MKIIAEIESNRLWDKQSSNLKGNYFQYLPSFNLTYKLNEASQLSTGFQVNNKLQDIYDLIPNHVILINKTLLRGTYAIYKALLSEY